MSEEPKDSNSGNSRRERTGSELLGRNEVARNLREARLIWGPLSLAVRKKLRELTKKYHLSIASGDITLLGGQLYITHGGLLRIGSRSRCSGILTALQKDMSDPIANRWVFKATVYKTLRSKGFVGYGDANPSNTTASVRGAEMRIAETRAVNRALRKAYGIGLCSVEELASLSTEQEPLAPKSPVNDAKANGSNNGQPRLRDQLCVLIRHHNLDPTLVKAYAADFCGTTTLSGASREHVQSFISHLSVAANENRDALICKLNSYARPSEVQP